MTFRRPHITPAVGIKQSTIDASQQTNLQLFKNPIPFAQYDWPRVQPVKIYVPDVTHTDINLYPNPIPILNVDLSKPQAIKPVVSDQNNLPDLVLINFSTPVVQTDWSKTQFPKTTVDQVYPNIALLQPVVNNPFIPVDFSKPFVPPIAKPDVQALNINLFTNPIPFAQYDWSKTQRLPSVLDLTTNVIPQSLWANLGPFPQYDWSKTTFPKTTVDQLYPNIALLNPTVVVANPFIPYDFSKPFVPTLAKPDQQSVNINLFTNPIPFGPYDWNIPHGVKLIVPDQTNLPDLVLQNFSTPFVQNIWPTVWPVKASVDPVYPNFLVLQVGNPFAQLDWSKAFVIPPKSSNQNDLPNLLLTQPSAASNPLGIFYWDDWSYTKAPVIIVPDQDNLPNIVLLVTPPPPPPVQPTSSGIYRSKWIQEYEKIQREQKADIKEAAAVLSRAGGLARAKALSPKQRSAIASLAAKTRWK